MIRKIKDKLAKWAAGKQRDDIDNTLYRFSKDIGDLKGWVNFLHNKQHKKPTGNFVISQEEMTGLALRVEHVRSEHKSLRIYIKELTKYLFEMHKSHKDMESRISKLEKDIKGRERTPKRTTQGHKIGLEKDIKVIKESLKGQNIKVIDKKAMNHSHKELLDLFYRAREPLDYARIAHLLRKKEKSIRNLIYEIREKGVKIKDHHIGNRRKGFYLDEEEKIKISGR